MLRASSSNCALIWLSWKFQPWMRTGRAIHIASTHLDDYDFQIWLRKNAGITEPFATWLFARRQGGKWMPYLLDFEDTYRPVVTLQKEGSGILIIRDVRG